MHEIQLNRMIGEINAIFPLSDSVKKAISKVNREEFVPSGLQSHAFKLDALPMGAEQWISSPLTVAKMSEYLKIDSKTDSVLEIGCGSGYQASVLSFMTRRVFSIERIERLLIEARTRFKTLDIMNINTKLDDGQKGWEQYAKFDRILFSAHIKSIPQAIIDQLSDGGILVAPIIIDGKERVCRYKKSGTRLNKPEILEECSFVAVIDGVSK